MDIWVLASRQTSRFQYMYLVCIYTVKSLQLWSTRACCPVYQGVLTSGSLLTTFWHWAVTFLLPWCKWYLQPAQHRTHMPLLTRWDHSSCNMLAVDAALEHCMWKKECVWSTSMYSTWAFTICCFITSWQHYYSVYYLLKHTTDTVYTFLP